MNKYQYEQIPINCHKEQSIIVPKSALIHSMWTFQTLTHIVRKAEPGGPDE